MKKINSRIEFEEALNKSGIQVFVFSTKWCGDCMFIKPFMSEVEKEFDMMDFYEIDRDQCLELAQELEIMGIPSFVCFQSGKEISRFVSSLRKTRQEIEAYLNETKNKGGINMAFKDFMKAILNEDVELDDDEMEEEVLEEPVKEEKVIQPVVQDVQIQPISAYPEAEVEMFTSPVVEPKKEPKTSIFTGLDAEDVARRESHSVNKPYKYDRRKMMKIRTNEDLDYKPIISPIFGDIKEEEKKFEKVHDAIKLPKPVDDTSFVQILSPMYGTNIPSAKPVESIPTMNPGSKKNEEALSLSDMLEKPKKTTTKQEDLFSLKD